VKISGINFVVVTATTTIQTIHPVLVDNSDNNNNDDEDYYNQT